MPPLAWSAAGLAALVAALAIMVRGKMVPDPRRALSPVGGGGSPDGSGIPDLGDEDPFRRFPRPRAASGFGPTETDTGVLPPSGDWGEPSGGPSMSYESPGDGDGAAVPGERESSGSIPFVQPAPSPGSPGAHQPGGGAGGGASGGYNPQPGVTPTPTYGGGYVPYVPPGTPGAGGLVPGSGAHVE